MDAMLTIMDNLHFCNPEWKVLQSNLGRDSLFADP